MITLTQRKQLAEKIRREAYFWLENTDVERPLATRAATDAANEHGRVLALTLSENGIEVER